MKLQITLISMLLNVGINAESLSTIEGFGESIAGVAKTIVGSFKSMGGSVPSGYQYSFCFFNGLSHTVTVKAKGMKEIMGTQFGGSTKTSMVLNPGESSGKQFNGISLYFEIECSDQTGTFFTETHYQLGVRNDTKVYAYHTYQDEGGNSCGEEVGSGYTTSNQFMGMMYNNTQNIVPVSFMLGSYPITIELEPQSFNYLTDVGTYLIRGQTGSFNFGTYGSVTVAQEGMGFASSTKGLPAGTTPPPATAAPYNYEIYNNQAFETGMSAGNFVQPTTGAVRSITPMPCYIWNQSADFSQASYSDTLIPTQAAGQSLWLLYTGPGWNSQTKAIEQPFMGVIPYGQVVEALLIRPRLQDYYARLYLIRLNTTDASRAQFFLNSIAQGTLAVPQLKVDSTVLAQQTISMMSQFFPDTIGLLQDSNGTQGYVMLEDVFLPYGMGSGPFYYAVPSPNYDISQVFTTFTFLQSFSSSKEMQQMMQNLQTSLTQWIQTYPSDPTSVQQSMKQFLLDNGASNCVITDKKGNKTLTPAGITALNMMLYGPASLSQLPLCYLAGQNYESVLPNGFPTSFVSFPVTD